jgi:DNA-3-methyladenine glycosylase II
MSEEVLRRDPVMARLIDEHGPIELEPADDEFRRFVVSIINQSVSTASAKAVRERVFERFEITPEALLDAEEDRLRDAGLSRSKAEYIKNVAQRFEETDLRREALSDWEDEKVIDELTGIRGVGEWTARMYLMFALGREDVFPIGDLAVRRGMETLYGELSRAEMVEQAEDWRPYRSLATLYIWAEYES